MTKLHFIFDKTKKNSRLKKILLKKYKSFTPNNSDVFVVLGGDGFMLHTLKNIKNIKNHFMASTRGHLVF